MLLFSCRAASIYLASLNAELDSNTTVAFCSTYFPKVLLARQPWHWSDKCYTVPSSKERSRASTKSTPLRERPWMEILSADKLDQATVLLCFRQLTCCCCLCQTCQRIGHEYMHVFLHSQDYLHSTVPGSMIRFHWYGFWKLRLIFCFLDFMHVYVWMCYNVQKKKISFHSHSQRLDNETLKCPAERIIAEKERCDISETLKLMSLHL